jgi:hypothetical protein
LNCRGGEERLMGHNEIYDCKVVKFTINIPIADYEKITKQCKERRIHRSVWVREAIQRNFTLSHSTRELIQYEIMRHTGEIRQENHIPMVEKCTTSSARTQPDHGFHKFPGFIGGLMRNTFVMNKIRQEKEGWKNPVFLLTLVFS